MVKIDVSLSLGLFSSAKTLYITDQKKKKLFILKWDFFSGIGTLIWEKGSFPSFPWLLLHCLAVVFYFVLVSFVLKLYLLIFFFVGPSLFNKIFLLKIRKKNVRRLPLIERMLNN